MAPEVSPDRLKGHPPFNPALMVMVNAIISQKKRGFFILDIRVPEIPRSMAIIRVINPITIGGAERARILQMEISRSLSLGSWRCHRLFPG